MELLAPMLAVAGEPFDSPEHLFEIKWDGVRALVEVQTQSVCMWGREQGEYASRYPELAELCSLPAGTILDGEVVRLVKGRADFNSLLRRHQLISPRRIREAAVQQPVTYVVFDILSLAGRSLLRETLSQRREQLQSLPGRTNLQSVIFSAGTIASGQQYFQEVSQQGHEGMMAKRLSSPYQPGKRSQDWQKIKPRQQTVAVIIGYRQSRGVLRALQLAALQQGELNYLGEVRAGLPAAVRSSLLALLQSSPTRATPVVPTTARSQWIEPQWYCLVRSFGRSGDGRLRVPSFIRLLADANARP